MQLVGLLPFYLTPYPNLTCSTGPLHPRRGAVDQMVTARAKTCPEECLKKEPDWSFPSQSEEVYVRKCVSDANG